MEPLAYVCITTCERAVLLHVPGNIVKYDVAFYSAKSTDIRGLHVTYAILLFTVVMLELQYYRLCTHLPSFFISCGDVTEVHGRVYRPSDSLVFQATRV